MSLLNNNQIVTTSPGPARATWAAGQNPGLRDKEAAGLRQASQMFEAQFVKMMLGEMRKTLSREELFNGGFGEEMFTDLLDQERADVIVQGRGIGLSDMLERQLGRRGSPRPAQFKMTADQTSPPSAAPETGGEEQAGEKDLASPAVPAPGPEKTSYSGRAQTYAPVRAWPPWAGMAQAARKAASPAEPEGTDREKQYLWPVEAEVSSAFGPRFHPILKTVRPHQGIDLKAAYGTPVQAAEGGTVIFAGERGGLGQAIEVEHPDGSRAVYGHCSRLKARQGQEVIPGQVIARVGDSGLTTGAHLHFEIHNPAGQAIDPLLCLAPRGESALARLY
ncbi:MAG: peptidoglycan DD-metalloendopeptidase family protein [Desulfarculales bacterium]|jgi:murein DD-endopeptidase MepM/ murein hydrolase activator NlpD|nr:peptidoglycan DD-metalloendopeptidase family protein [Desulfarculales bacterium]